VSGMKGGKLWVAATPLGNDGDFSPRAREVLAAADVVLAEDTRRAGLLFKRLGLPQRRCLSFYEHNEAGRVPQVLELLGQGLDVAVISDAGTPLVSDPGYKLVRACREAGFHVSPVPGPSAVTAALSASGLPPYPFTFLGFAPRKSSDIRRLFARHAATGCALVFFERASRLKKALTLAAEALGDRECCIAREMTKTHEEFIPGRLAELAGRELTLLGEATVVIGPEEERPETPEDEVLRIFAEEAAIGGKPKEVARRASERCAGWTPSRVYELAQTRRNTGA
jgi:16S rRNA (cytidine1402-2'-O)-methyltransferase